ncbi:MAG: pilin [Candidatus Paceibacterota bacterium]
MKPLSQLFTIILTTTLVFFLILPMIAGIGTSSADIEILPVAEAQEDTDYKFLAPIGGFGESVDVTSTSSFTNYIQNGITIMIGFAIMAAIVLIIAAGFRYMTSVSQSGVSQAKKTMSNAILGLILALTAVLILQTINPDLVELNAVKTVTTSGSSFDDHLQTGGFESSNVVSESIIDGPEDRRGNQHCYRVDGEWADWTHDRFYCYHTEENCEDGYSEAQQSYPGSIDHGCTYYYGSEGTLFSTEYGQFNELESGINGVSTESGFAAVEDCEQEVENIAVGKDAATQEYNYEQCVTFSGGIERFDTDNCSIVCTEEVDEI